MASSKEIPACLLCTVDQYRMAGIGMHTDICVVTYADKSTKRFAAWLWLSHRDKIKANLIDKGLASVEIVKGPPKVIERLHRAIEMIPKQNNDNNNETDTAQVPKGPPPG